MRVPTQKGLEADNDTEKEVYGEVLARWDDIGIEFTIEKTNNDSETCHECFDDYKEIFRVGREHFTTSGSSNLNKNYSRTKILICGDPGVGKSRLVWEITKDWTRGKFDRFYLVALVSLRLANPSDPIEHIIIRQNYQTFESKRFRDYLVPKETFRTILERFGGRCLIILDGLNEHDVKNNKDLIDIINDNSFLHCNFIFITTSSMAKFVEKRCQIVVSVRGIKKEAAETCLSRILEPEFIEDKIDKVADLKVDLVNKSLEIITCPMLLKKLCFLIVETEISMNEDITLGLLYYKLVLCLYTKGKTSNTIGKPIKEECNNYLIRLGKLALENLWFRKPLTIKDCQSHLGNDFNLVNGLVKRHPDCDNIIFDHNTIQQFFGAFTSYMTLKCMNMNVKLTKRTILRLC